MKDNEKEPTTEEQTLKNKPADPKPDAPTSEASAADSHIGAALHVEDSEDETPGDENRRQPQQEKKEDVGQNKPTASTLQAKETPDDSAHNDMPSKEQSAQQTQVTAEQTQQAPQQMGQQPFVGQTQQPTQPQQMGQPPYAGQPQQSAQQQMGQQPLGWQPQQPVQPQPTGQQPLGWQPQQPVQPQPFAGQTQQTAYNSQPSPQPAPELLNGQNNPATMRSMVSLMLVFAILNTINLFTFVLPIVEFGLSIALVVIAIILLVKAPKQHLVAPAVWLEIASEPFNLIGSIIFWSGVVDQARTLAVLGPSSAYDELYGGRYAMASLFLFVSFALRVASLVMAYVSYSKLRKTNQMLQSGYSNNFMR